MFFGSDTHQQDVQETGARWSVEGVNVVLILI